MQAVGLFLGLSLTASSAAFAADGTEHDVVDSSSASLGSSSGEGGVSGESTAAISSLALPSTNRRLHYEFFNWSTFKAADVYNQGGQGWAQGYFGVNYRFAPDQAISFRQPYAYNYEFPKTGTSTDLHAADFYVEYQNGKLFEFWTDARVIVISARIGLPTGEESRFVTGTQGYNFNWLEATKPVSRSVNANFHVRTIWYNQTKSTYIGSDGNLTGTRDFGFDLAPEIEWKITDRLSFTHSMGTSNSFYYGDANVNYKQDFSINLWTALNYQASDQLWLTFAVSDGADLDPAGRSFGLYRNDETCLQLMLSATI